MLALSSIQCSVLDPLDGYAGGSSGAASFDRRCRAPGVIRCYGFDAAEDLADYYEPPASGSRADIDRQMKTSGAGALHFRVPANPTNGELTGLFGINFADDWSVVIGSGESVFVQWRQRFSSSFLDDAWDGSGHRQAAITLGDRIGASAGVRSSPGVTLGNFYYRGLPELSDTTGVPFHVDVPGESCVYSQNAAGCNSCQENDERLCALYRTNEWMTFQIGIRLGSAGSSDRVEAWVGKENEPSRKTVDVEVTLPSDGGGNKALGKVWFELTDSTFGSGPAIETETWIEELVISRARIEDP
jgi:hypothetical protein